MCEFFTIFQNDQGFYKYSLVHPFTNYAEFEDNHVSIVAEDIDVRLCQEDDPTDCDIATEFFPIFIHLEETAVWVDDKKEDPKDDKSDKKGGKGKRRLLGADEYDARMVHNHISLDVSAFIDYGLCPATGLPADTGICDRRRLEESTELADKKAAFTATMDSKLASSGLNDGAKANLVSMFDAWRT